MTARWKRSYLGSRDTILPGGKQARIVCFTCDGDGQIGPAYREVTCSLCHGTGRIVVELEEGDPA